MRIEIKINTSANELFEIMNIFYNAEKDIVEDKQMLDVDPIDEKTNVYTTKQFVDAFKNYLYPEEEPKKAHAPYKTLLYCIPDETLISSCAYRTFCPSRYSPLYGIRTIGELRIYQKVNHLSNEQLKSLLLGVYDIGPYSASMIMHDVTKNLYKKTKPFAS